MLMALKCHLPAASRLKHGQRFGGVVQIRVRGTSRNGEPQIVQPVLIGEAFGTVMKP